MKRVLLIADDFTGSLDTGIQFVKSNVKTDVFAYAENFYDAVHKGEIKQDAAVLVVNSDTRHVGGEPAYKKVSEIVKAGLELGVDCIYKKTDSALRGNIGAELTAVLDVTGADALHFVPALPGMNRVTIDGVHFIDGIPTAESEFANDKYAPVTRSAVNEIIGLQSKIPVFLHTDQKPGYEHGVHVYDAKTYDDINVIAENLKPGIPEKTGSPADILLLSGCSGFAGAVPGLLGLEGAEAQEMEQFPGLIVICGSTNRVTRNQLDYAAENGFVRKTLGPKVTLDPEWVKSPEFTDFIAGCVADYARTKRLIVDTNDATAGMTEHYAEMHGLSTLDVRHRIAGTLGDIAKALLNSGQRATLLLTGGDTLLAFVEHLGVNQFTPVRELTAGVVLSRVNYHGENIPIISKSGGFGRKDLIPGLVQE